MKGFTPKWSVADFSSLISTRASSTRTGSLIVPVFMMALLLFSPLLSSVAVAVTVHLEHPHKGAGETVAVAVSEPKSPVATAFRVAGMLAMRIAHKGYALT